MGERPRLIAQLERGHDVLDVGRVILRDGRCTVPEQNDALGVRKEPGRAQAQRNFRQRATVFLKAGEAARLPIGQLAAHHRLPRVHVPQFVGGARRQFALAGQALVGRCGIEVAPVHVLGETRVVVLQPLLVVGAPHQREPLRPIGWYGAETRRHDAPPGCVLTRAGQLDMGKPARMDAVDRFIEAADTFRVVGLARAAIGMCPIQPQAFERLGRRRAAVKPVAITTHQH
ncbi:hypothetical protein D9M72_455580 [compost metagenome]